MRLHRKPFYRWFEAAIHLLLAMTGRARTRQNYPKSRGLIGIVDRPSWSHWPANPTAAAAESGHPMRE